MMTSWCRKDILTIHKNSLSLCQGLCSENMFYSEVKAPDKANQSLVAARRNLVDDNAFKNA
jgi:hypothetical protein